MTSLRPLHRFNDTDSVLVVTDLATPLGAACARRMAGEWICFVAGGPPGPATDAAEAEIQRVRALHRITETPIILREDPARGGAHKILDTAIQQFGHVDTIIAVAQPERGIPAVAMTPLMSMMRCSLEVLARQRSGHLILALDSTASLRPLPPIGQARLEAAFESLVQTSARAHLGDNIRINGIVAEPRNDAGSHSYMLMTGSTDNGSSMYSHNAATGIISMLSSSEGQTTTGKLHRISVTHKNFPSGNSGALAVKVRPSP